VSGSARCRRRSWSAGAESRAAPAEALAQEKPVPEETASPEEAPPQNLLHLLLDSRQGFAALLLLAAGFGAAHALTPGHGKTLAAAYLVGERGTVGHALALGLVTTLTHTAAVLVLAALLPLLFRDTAKASVQTALELVGGLLIAGLGLWLLMVRLAGRADHIHLGGGHHHHHDGGHTHDVPAVRPGWRGLVLLGVSGGLVPCWDALAMLALAVSTQKLWLALPLLLAFSAGLAGVLVAVGVAVVQTRKWAGARWGNLERFRGLERALPLASAAVVTAMGLWLCFESVHDAGHDAPPPAVSPAEPVR
jgi:ABC-type nickel/cobalt efflux system permease component RcnA